MFLLVRLRYDDDDDDDIIIYLLSFAFEFSYF